MRPSDHLILLIDDEPDIIDFVSYCLEKEGFKVVSALDGKKGIAAAIKHKPDLILLDVMMPEMDGIEVCYELRSIPELANVRIAFLTARTEDYSQIAGLEAGGDDYINKPIKPRLLVARLKALLKKTGPDISSNRVIRAGGYTIDLDKRTVLKGDQVLQMAKKEFDLMHMLMASKGKVLTREEIYNTLWNQSYQTGDRTIDVHVLRLRNKIGDDAIKTIKGVGYRFNATRPKASA